LGDARRGGGGRTGDARQEHGTLLEFGIDRSNMGTQWTLGWPSEPNVSPFLAAEYNKPGNFEARRVTVLDGIARLRAQWFRDGFGKGSPDLFVDLVKLVHARGMKILAVYGAAASDYPPDAYLSKEKSAPQKCCLCKDLQADILRPSRGLAMTVTS
jgi:hypothetical protein